MTVRSHAGIYSTSLRSNKQTEWYGIKSLRVDSAERPEMYMREMWRRHSQYDKILDQAWLPTLLWAKREPVQESGQPSSLVIPGHQTHGQF